MDLFDMHFIYDSSFMIVINSWNKDDNAESMFSS